MHNLISIKPKIVFTVFIMVMSVSSFATNLNIFQAIKNPVTVTFKVLGNCSTCKKTIETAANKKGIVISEWNVDSKILSLTYNSKKTTTDEILKRIAYAGYDNEKYLAPQNAYNKLADCCKYERKKTSVTKIATHEISIQDTIKKESVNPLSEVYSAYFALKDALVLDDGTTASNKAKELFKAIDKVPMDKMTSAQHTVWMKYMSKLSYDAEHIKGVTKTEHQREHFNSLSKNMFEVMKVITPAYSVYLNHCPMYNDGKGANWISKESVIKNPYYGSKMLTCGKTTETLK